MGYDNSNSGALFKNKDKDRDTDRDYSGNAEITCPHCNKSADHWISCWINTSKAGMKYMKLKFNAKESQIHVGSNLSKNEDGTAKPPSADDDFDDIPF